MKNNRFNKITMVLLFAFLGVSLLTAQSGQKVFPVDSPVYRTISRLYLLQGRAMPSSTGPWNAAELRMMLEKIDTASLSEELYEEYCSALAEVKKTGEKGDDRISTTISRSLNGETYIHTNTDGPEIQGKTDDEEWNKLKLYSGRNAWSYDLTKITPFYVMNWETWFSDDFYGWFEFPLQNTYRTRIQIGDRKIATNIFGFQNGSFDMAVADLNFPYRAFVGFGNDNWAFELGRDRLNWGLGTTGNLMMSDNFPYHNMLRYTAFSDAYKYTFLISSYPHEMNYYYKEDESTKYHLTNGDREDVEGNEFYISHRMEGRFFDDRLSGALTESVIVQYESNHIPWELLNPVSFWHNNYTASTSNSILGLELNWTPFKGFNCYGQFALDELQLLGEDKHWPNGLGFLGGCTYAMPLLDGVMTVNLEGAYTDPYMYLRYGKGPSNGGEAYGIDFIVADRIYSNDLLCRAAYEEFCIGYPYGPDSAVGNLNCSWNNSKLTLNANWFFMAHGTHDFWTKWAQKASLEDEYVKANYTTPTTSHESSDNQRFDVSNRDSVCYTNAITLGASYQALPSLNVYGQADYVMTKNAFNDSRNGTENDLQLVLGVKWSF